MKVLEQVMKTTAVCSEDGAHRYKLQKVWRGEGEKLKSAAIIMAFPCSSGIDSMDLTTLIVINCLTKQGYNSVDLLNLYSKIDAKIDKEPEAAHMEANDETILESCKQAENVIIAWGSGYSNNKRVLARQAQVLQLLAPIRSKVLSTENCQHPLTPALRNDLHLQQFNFANANAESSAQPEAVQKKKVKRAKSATEKAEEAIPSDTNS